jgi:FlaA1/EpsC-like NDP-sugar epimerase
MDCIGDRGTEVQEFYRGASVLITGGTGFMGKALMEKLLRSCPHLSNIYVLIRSKKGKDAETRLDDTLNDPVSTNLFDLKLISVQLCSASMILNFCYMHTYCVAFLKQNAHRF